MASTSKGKGREVNISLSIQRTAMAANSGKEPTDHNNFYNIDQVPDDVWLFLFEYLTTPDLSSVSKASKKFYALTQRPLLRELTWAKATGTLRNVQDWGDGAVLEPFRGVVRKVNVKLSYKKVNQHSALLLPVDWELYDSVHHRLLSFSNLRSLDLCGTIITPALYPVLEDIPSLRELSIIRCTFIWTYMFSPLLTNLGRQAPNPGLFVYNPANRSLSHQHGLIRAPSDPIQRAQQQTWLLENTVFDFTTRLSHITHLSLQCNRFTSHSSETDDLPYPPSEISRPCILHPLYLLSIPSLTHLTLTWTPTLAQVYDTLKQRFNFSGGQNGVVGAGGNMNMNNGGAGVGAMNPGPVPGAVNVQAQHQFATLLFAANTLGMNLFTPLVVALGALEHATIIIEDLSRDMMESISALFEQRIRNVNNISGQGVVAPLRIHLRVGKHTLTEQNMGSSNFRLPGVYKYEGPLPIAGLLANDGAGGVGVGGGGAAVECEMEEVVMNEAMEMNSLLTTLARLPRTLKKLDIRMFCWDREILYAVHSLFRELCELVVRYGREELEENTYVVLGSDILPDLKNLHTIKLIPSIECIKRDTQFRYPYPGGHFHHFHGNHWWQQGGGGGGHPGGPPAGGGGGHASNGAYGGNNTNNNNNGGYNSNLTSHPPLTTPIGNGGGGAGGSTQQDYTTSPDPIDINDYDLYDFGDEDLYYAISRGITTVPPAARAPAIGMSGGIASSSSSSSRGSGIGSRGGGGGSTANHGIGGGSSSISAAAATSAMTTIDQDDDASSTSSDEASVSTSVPPSPALTPGGASQIAVPLIPNRFTNFLLSPRRLPRTLPQMLGSNSHSNSSNPHNSNSGSGTGGGPSSESSSFAGWGMQPPPTPAPSAASVSASSAVMTTSRYPGRTGVRGRGGPIFGFGSIPPATPSASASGSALSSHATSPASSTSSSSGSSLASLSGSDGGLPPSSSSSSSSASSHFSSSSTSTFTSTSNSASTSMTTSPSTSSSSAGAVLTERQRIALSLQEDLEDYLVGWNRHCPSLRVVQMESGWFWMRRFGGDPWRKMKASD